MKSVSQQNKSHLVRSLCILSCIMSTCESPGLCPENCDCIPSTHLPGLVVNCTDVERFIISQNYPLDTLSLYLDNNSIRTLDTASFLSLTSLRNFSVSYNLLEEIPPLQSFHHLHNLLLSHNKLTKIPRKMPPSLKILHLDGNEILSVDFHDFENLGSLEELRLNSNNIFEVNSVTFSSCDDCSPLLKALGKLDLSANQIKFVESKAFLTLTNLKALSLSNNKLKVLESATLNGLENLLFLDLHNNLITDIAKDAFKPLVSLKYLYLRGNFLKEIPAHLPMLEWLDVSWNQIQHVNESRSKEMLYPIDVIVLAHNPLHCDCHLLWLKEFMDRREYVLNYINVPADDLLPSCESPVELAGESWDLIADDMFLCPEEDQGIKTRHEKDTKPRKTVVFDETADKNDVTYVVQKARVTLTYSESAEDSITVHYKVKGRPYKDSLYVKYYEYGKREKTLLFSQVSALNSFYTLHNLVPNTVYLVCIIPRTESQDLDISNEDRCMKISTLPVKVWWKFYVEDLLNADDLWSHVTVLPACVFLAFMLVCLLFCCWDWIFGKVLYMENCKNNKEHIN